MSRYDWPAAPGGVEEDDDPGARARFVARRRTDFDPDGALAAGRSAPPALEGRGPRAPASGRQHLWQPLGPMTVLAGQATGAPRITGRVNAIAVHPEGERIYAASGNGGVWYSRDAGANWISLGGFAPTNTAGLNRPAQRNSCGAIHVDFKDAEKDDEVYVGTGETAFPGVGMQPNAQPGRGMGGIGILVARGPAVSALPDPWTREAKNLLGNGVGRIVQEPGGTTLVAATRTGLFQRPAAPGADIDWIRLEGDPFDTLTLECTDALWTAGDGARPARLWVWVRHGEKSGLWVRAAGETDFKPIATTGAVQRRAALAASTPPTQVWVFNDQGAAADPALFRVAAATAAKPVATRVAAGVPRILKTQGFYDITIAVDPARPNRVVLGGSTFTHTTPEGIAVDDGAIVTADVALKAGVLTYGEPKPFSMISIGVHADIHEVKFSNDGKRLWTCCDGGVLRSDEPERAAGFVAVNNGLAIVETNYVATHPNCEGYLVAGLQDNGVLTRLSNGVWKLAGFGDGGGVVLDPLQPGRFFRQHYRGFWSSSDGAVDARTLLKRGGAWAKDEFDRCAFYSTAAAIGHRRGAPAPAVPDVGQIIVGTNRVWYTADFGANWVTLPTGNDPLPANLTRDGFGQPITVCRWQSPDVAWILGEGRLMRYARTPGSDSGGGPGTWTRETVIVKGVKNKKDATSADGPIRDSAVWTDIAVNLDPPPAAGQPPAMHGTRGAIYMGTIGKPDNDGVDTLWWFDGTSKWFKTGLRTDATGVPAPVTSIVCDPALPEEVYVGTTVGVWKGTRTQIGGANPAWTWSKRVNGLPEAAVEDLQIFSDGPLRLLRAAIAARGVWELRLDVADVADLTYLRAHDDDLRYRDSAIATQRDLKTPRSWHGSPDVRPRTASAAVAAPESLPWTGGQFFIEDDVLRPFALDNDELRRFQAALRSRTAVMPPRTTVDERVRATGDWDRYFDEVLRDLGAPLMPSPPAPPNQVCIDDGFWDAQMTGVHASAEPWGAGPPSEADLLELTAPLREGSLTSTSCTLPPRPSKVDIVVHHRGLDARDGANVRVTLLKWIDPKKKKAAKWIDSTTWFKDDVPWTGAVNEVLNSATGASAQAFAAGWSFVGTTNATRRRTLAGQTLDPTHSGIATFDLNLSGLKNNTVVLLVAIIRAGDDIALAPARLHTLAMSRPNVAVRSVRIVR